MIASIKNGCSFIGCDISEKSINISKERAKEFFKSGKDILQPESLLSDDFSINKLF